VAADLVAVELEPPSGDPLLVEWRSEALAGLDPRAEDAGGVWRLAGELDWDAIEALRILSGRLGDGRLLAIAAVRPAGASGHGDELTAGAIGEPDGFERIDEVLLSTEYGSDGLPRRVGLELYPDQTSLPMRIAGVAIAPAEAGQSGGVRRVRVGLELRGNGSRGAAVYELLGG
jgi:hypothetical protein